MNNREDDNIIKSFPLPSVEKQMTQIQKTLNEILQLQSQALRQSDSLIKSLELLAEDGNKEYLALASSLELGSNKIDLILDELRRL